MQGVVLLTDQPVFSAGMAALCEKSGSLELSGICSKISDLCATVAEVKPRLAVIDYRPELDLAQLRDVCMAAESVRVVLIGRSIPPEFACQARELGVSAVLSSTMTLGDLAVSFSRVMHGELLFDQRITEGLPPARTIRFTPRESELVTLLAYGLKNREISSRLGISEGTVKVYLSKLFDKVGARDRFELALFGLKSLGAPAPGVSDAIPDDTGRALRGDSETLTDSESVDPDTGSRSASPPGSAVLYC